MASESQFLRTLIPLVPTEIASKLRSLCASSPTNESTLENLLRFVLGCEASPESSTGVKDQWAAKQAALRPVLSSLVPTSVFGDKKRSRDDEESPVADTDSQQSKKPRLADSNGATTSPEPGAPLFTLHSLSVTSPVRKKVDITIHENAVVMTNPASKAMEATIPTSFLRRAFILPTRGKTKPHWTVVVLSADVPDAKGKATAPTANGAASENQQIIFGIDAAATTNFVTTTYTTSQPVPETQPKGTQTLPPLRQFLSHLPAHAQPILEPAKQAVFKSACPGIMGNATSSSSNGIPGAEAYRGAKAGNLWFAKEGVLWGESKPCEFWAVEDLDGREGGLRIQGAGRTCSVILIRKPTNGGGEVEESMHVDGDVDGQDQDEPGDETEFGMVDAKEREGIQEWVRHHRRLFWMPSSSSSATDKGKGKEKESGATANPAQKPVMQNTGPMTIHTLQELSDEEDEDFDVDVSDLDGSEHSSQDSSSSDEEGDGDGDGDGDAEGEEEGQAEGSGEDDGEGEGGVNAAADDVEDEDELGESEDDEETELDPARHPLLRPGAMPRMSKAALQMAVGIVEDAFMGTGGGGEGEEDEEDELDD